MVTYSLHSVSQEDELATIYKKDTIFKSKNMVVTMKYSFRSQNLKKTTLER